MIRMLRNWIRRQRMALARGEILRIGPFSLVLNRVIRQLTARLSIAEAGASRNESVPAFSRTAGDTASASTSRSVLFLHHCYYNFYYLAAALRRRGWDALSVSLEGPNSSNAKYYHGEDLNLFDEDPLQLQSNVERFFATVPGRFRMVHFYGQGLMSFFPMYFDGTDRYEVYPQDFALLRRIGVKIGYTVSGCLDGVAQTSVSRWSDSACATCPLRDVPCRCSDQRNLAWGHKVQLFCDLIATEGFPALDYQHGPKCYREPLTTALDAQLWRPDLAIPGQYRLPRAPGELLVYHGVGNYQDRTRNGRNIKGTAAVIDAIERLRREGMKVRLEFITDIPSKDVRFIQAQADVIVDQLNYGRYGATAREGMMLGIPTVCYINPSEPIGERGLSSLKECPLVTATEGSIYEVLKSLLTDQDQRRRIGTASRAFALKWHSAEACAERFEKVYDRLMAGLPLVDSKSATSPDFPAESFAKSGK